MSKLEQVALASLQNNNNILTKNSIAREYNLTHKSNGLSYEHDVDFYFKYQNELDEYGVFLEIEGDRYHFSPIKKGLPPNDSYKTSPNTAFRNRNIEFILNDRNKIDSNKKEILITISGNEINKQCGGEEVNDNFNKLLSTKINNKIEERKKLEERKKEIKTLDYKLFNNINNAAKKLNSLPSTKYSNATDDLSIRIKEVEKKLNSRPSTKYSNAADDLSKELKINIENAL